eukprot:m51a1_g10926 hypothetical protein (110) ;mRNA; r:115772-118160
MEQNKKTEQQDGDSKQQDDAEAEQQDEQEDNVGDEQQDQRDEDNSDSGGALVLSPPACRTGTWDGLLVPAQQQDQIIKIKDLEAPRAKVKEKIATYKKEQLRMTNNLHK